MKNKWSSNKRPDKPVFNTDPKRLISFQKQLSFDKHPHFLIIVIYTIFCCSNDLPSTAIDRRP